MVRKIIKWALITVSVLFLIVIAAFFTLTSIAGRQMEKKYVVEPEVIIIPADSASIERGRHSFLASRKTDIQRLH